MDAGTYQFTIVNNGIGPAVINDYSFFVDGKQVPGKGADLLPAVLKKVLAGREYTFEQNYLSSSYVMPAKEERIILDLQIRTGIPTEEEFKTLRERVRLYIAYTDMYKGTMVPFDSDVVA